MSSSEAPVVSPAGQAEKPFGHTGGHSGPESAIPIRVWLRRGPLRPAWAALCGALASGGLTLSTGPLLRLALLGFLVDVVWGGMWSALAATDWATPLRHWRGWHRGRPAAGLPYATPDGPAGRLARNWGQLRSWWAEKIRPTLGPTLRGVVVLLPLALVISGVLGARILLVTLAALALLQLLFAWSGGDARPAPGPRALFEIALPWLAGHVLFGPLTLWSVFVALAYGLSYAGGLRLAWGRSGLARWNLGQFVVILLLIVGRQPLAGGLVGLLALGQAIAQPALFVVENETVEPAAAARFFGFGQPWLMAAMLVAAWGVRAMGGGG